ncbi:hypothetical protein BD289DRAFT_430618 [Coniella lustricola]|uniref:Uncharacterized protein n=1 Tax=Coniella lustricola TaxID=2025994 RepID=A0A2T3ABK2_9PEZI|nr:hypothetical protein BD289DRAFT_430618 [Coniella lustricola]
MSMDFQRLQPLNRMLSLGFRFDQWWQGNSFDIILHVFASSTNMLSFKVACAESF